MGKPMSRDTAATLGGALTLGGAALLLTIFFRIENPGLAMMLVMSAGLLVIGTGITTDVKVRRELESSDDQSAGDAPSHEQGAV
ncbi:MAG: hypothetical protein ACYTGL_23215 [Planctomycetota bacterium]|jgi:hypothetical protein